MFLSACISFNAWRTYFHSRSMFIEILWYCGFPEFVRCCQRISNSGLVGNIFLKSTLMCGFLGRTLASSVFPIIDQFMTPPSVMPLSISQTAFLVIIRQTQKGMLTQTWKLWLIKLLYVQTLSFLINKFRMFVENFLFLKLCGDMKVMAHETGTCFGFDKKEKYNIRKSLHCTMCTLDSFFFLSTESGGTHCPTSRLSYY